MSANKNNWPFYHQELKNRGQITMWLTPGFEKFWFNKVKSGNKGVSHINFSCQLHSQERTIIFTLPSPSIKSQSDLST